MMRVVCFFLAVAFIAYLIIVSHAVVASAYTVSLISQQTGEPFDLTPFGAHIEQISSSTYLYADVRGNNGVYNRALKRNVDGEFYSDLETTFSEAFHIGFMIEEQFGVGAPVPFPFMILAVVQIAFVVFARLFVWGSNHFRNAMRLSTARFHSQILLSLLYLYVTVIWFQISRMIWASEIWGAGAFLNDIQIGRVCLYILAILSLGVYCFAVLATAGFQVRCHPKAKKQTCIKCHYNLEGLTGNCPECDLEIGAYIPSKLRINHWYLAAMFIITFFSPVMVASVYSLFG